MNPTAMIAAALAVVLAVGGAYVKGRGDGAELQQSEYRKIELAQEVARKSALAAAAAEVAKIDVKNVTIQAKVVERIRTETVYSECRHSPDAWKTIQEAYAP